MGITRKPVFQINKHGGDRSNLPQGDLKTRDQATKPTLETEKSPTPGGELKSRRCSMTNRRRELRIIKRFPPKSHIELRVPAGQNEPKTLRDCIECGAVSKMIVTSVFACTSCEILFN